MDYIYGLSTRHGEIQENLKTVGAEHSKLCGYISTVQEFGDGTKITDRCRIVKKYASKEVNGVCYDWYLIDKHYQNIDTERKTQLQMDKINANIDYLSMMSGISIPTEEGATNE